MQALSQSDMLSLWDRAQRLHPIDWGLLAIHTACPEVRDERIEDWPIGRRNRALLELRRATFGTGLKGWTACQRCTDKLEFELDASALADTPAADSDTTIAALGHQFRLPSSRDLAELADEGDAHRAAARLIERCRLRQKALPDGALVEATAWSDEDIEVIGGEMSRADPLAEIVLHFDCPACGESFEDNLDLSAFLWTEIEARAKRLLLDVHTLALAYGWSEDTILGLPPARRAFYLEMVHG